MEARRGRQLPVCPAMRFLHQARRSAAPCFPPPPVLALTYSRQRGFLLPYPQRNGTVFAKILVARVPSFLRPPAWLEPHSLLSRTWSSGKRPATSPSPHSPLYTLCPPCPPLPAP